MKKKNQIYVCLLVAALASLSCQRTITVSGEGDGKVVPSDKNISVNFEFTDGRRLADAVTSPVSGSFSFSSENKGATYILEYSVDGGDVFVIENIWDGVSRKLTGPLSKIEDYGEHTVSGKVYNINDASESTTFRETVMMLYEPVTVTDIKYITDVRYGEPQAFREAELLSGISGTVELSYEPETSLADWEIKASEPYIVFNTDDATIGNGKLNIPWTTVEDFDGESSTVTVNLILSDGKTPSEYQSQVTIKKDTDQTGSRYGFSFEINKDIVGNRSLSESSIHYELSIGEPYQDSEINIRISLDEKELLNEDSFVIGSTPIKNTIYPDEPTNLRKAKLTASFSFADAPERWYSISHYIYICTPKLRFHEKGDYAPWIDLSSSNNAIDVGHTYLVKLSGIPDELIEDGLTNRFSLTTSDKSYGRLTEIEPGLWELECNAYSPNSGLIMQIKAGGSANSSVYYYSYSLKIND